MSKNLSLFSMFFTFFALFVFAGCGETTVKTFDIVGKVVYNGTPIEGVTVESDIGGTFVTDEEGVFNFVGLTSATVLTFSADGYVFSQPKIVIYRETTDLTVTAEREYLLNGQVVSNNIGVAGVTVQISGLTPLTVITNSEGRFTATVAGEVTLKSSKEGYVFADKTVSIDNPNVTISGTTDITATVEGVDNAVLKINNDIVMELNDKVYSASNVSLGSVITPVLAGYHFEPSSYTITMENEQIKFTAYRLYSVSGTTKSGEFAIEDVNILVNGEVAAQSNTLGEFYLSNLWGDNTIAFEHSIFRFNSQFVKENSQDINAQGTFNLSGTVVCEGQPLEFVRVFYGQKNIPTDEQGNFSFDGVSVGDTLSFEKEGYKIDDYTIDSAGNIVVTAIEYFYSKITIYEDNLPLVDAVVRVQNEEYYSNASGVVEIPNCLNSFVATVSKDGYTSITVNISRENNQVVASLDKYFDVNISVHSGEIVLENANIWVGNDRYDTQQNGILKLENCVKSINIQVNAEGYNTLTLVADKNNSNLDFNLAYTVSGTVCNGDLNVDAEIIATDRDGKQTKTNSLNGEFSFDLYGENEITVNAEGLIYNNETVNRQTILDFTTAYDISGTLTADGLPMENATVLLINKNGTQTVTTGSDGAFEFVGLSGQYTLITQNNQGVTLQPSNYLVNKGGIYNFDASGYAVSGTVLCGDNGVAGVTVKAGDSIATTNENGVFEFDLIRGDVQVIALKTGYTFEETYDLTPEDNGANLTFNGTYKLEGKITCASENLADVTVSILDRSVKTDENGYFMIDKLSGENEIVFAKQGFEFNAEQKYNGYEYINATATFTVMGKVVVGENALEGVVISNGKIDTTTNDLGEFQLSGIVFGDVLSANKNGYKFNSITVKEYGQELKFNGTFDISGTVKSAGMVVAGVVVQFNGKATETDSLGRFSFTDLQEFGEMTFTKSGYEFSPIEINGPQELEVLASFSVNGRVTIEQEGLAGVTISVGNKSTTTDSDGYYTLNGLSTKGWLSVEKLGYDFVGDLYFNGASTLDFTATYFVMFTVECGDADMGRAVVTTSATLETLPNNSFIIRGLVGSHTFIVNAETKGFDEKEVTVTDYVGVLVVTLTYTVKLKLKTPMENVLVTYFYNDTQYETTFDASGIANLTGIVGAGEWSVEKANYKFTPSTGTFSLPKTVDITYQVVYSISGTVRSGDIGVYGMVMTLNGVSSTTDENGYYELTNLVGSGSLKGVLSAENCDTVTVQKDNISGAGVFNLNVESTAYGYWLFQKGYQNLRDNPYGYMISSKGVVHPSTGGDQHAEGLKIKDKNGVYLTESKNYGDKIDIFGIKVDPRVDLIGYYDSKLSGSVMQYKFIKGDYVTYDEGADKVVTAEQAYNDIRFADINITGANSFQDNFGGHPTGMYIYIINKQTSVIKNLQKLDNGNIVVTMNLATTDACLANYKKQIKAFSNQNPTFTNITLTYTLDKKGNIISNIISEAYNVTQVINVNITSTMTETFTMFTASNADNYLINKSNYGL